MRLSMGSMMAPCELLEMNMQSPMGDEWTWVSYVGSSWTNHIKKKNQLGNSHEANSEPAKPMHGQIVQPFYISNGPPKCF